MWLYGCASAEPWPENRRPLSASAARMARYTSGSFSSSQESSVGPKLKLIEA